jgi:hypothetical protein
MSKPYHHGALREALLARALVQDIDDLASMGVTTVATQ